MREVFLRRTRLLLFSFTGFCTAPQLTEHLEQDPQWGIERNKCASRAPLTPLGSLITVSYFLCFANVCMQAGESSL